MTAPGTAERRAPRRIGLVAGSGMLPLLVAQGAQKLGIEVVAAAHVDETDQALATAVQQLRWVRLGQVDRIIRYFKAEGAECAVMAGGIGRVRAFTHFRPDLGAVKIIAALRSFRDDHMLRTVADYFARRGLPIVSATAYVKDLIAPEGVLCGPALDSNQERDARLGWEVATLLGQADVGQTVAVKRAHVLAVEAIEGTDATIVRAGALDRHHGGAVVKRSKPGQDQRFDLPAVGVQTVQAMALAGFTALVLEANQTLLLDPPAIFAAARAAGVTVVAWSTLEPRR